MISVFLVTFIATRLSKDQGIRKPNILSVYKTLISPDKEEKNDVKYLYVNRKKWNVASIFGDFTNMIMIVTKQ